MILTSILPQSSSLQVDLAVSQVGALGIEVQPGSFVANKTSYTLAEVQEATLSVYPNPSAVRGWLARDKSTNEVFLFADHVERVEGGYDFYPVSDKSCSFEALHLLFSANIPANTTDLAGVQVRVSLRKGLSDG